MPVYELHDSKFLFLQISEGNVKSFEILFNTYKDRIYSLAIKLIRNSSAAEEIVQEVFLSVWHNKGRLRDVENADAYLFTIAYNKIFAQLRAVSKDQKLLQELIINYTDKINITEEQIDLNQSLDVINQVIDQLPEQRRLIFLYSREEGLSYKEIADRLNISPHTVRNQLADAKKQIRQLLLEKGFLMLALYYSFN